MAAKKKATTTQSIGASPKPAYIPYVTAFKILAKRLNGTTVEEIVAWVWIENLAAYPNANELDSPPRFFFGPPSKEKDFDYVGPAMTFWFLANDIESFEPKDRYITGTELIERWSKLPGIKSKAFIVAKIHESRLQDMHPNYGVTQGSSPDKTDFPTVEIGLFALSEVEGIETEDFGVSVAKNQLPNKKITKEFLDAFNRLLDEIAKRLNTSRDALTNEQKMLGGTKKDLHAVAILFDDALDVALVTFDNYLENVVQFKGGRRSTNATNPYAKIFPEYEFT